MPSIIIFIFISVYFIHQENVKKALINNTDKELIKRDLQIKDLQAKYDSVKNKKDYSADDINNADLQTAKNIALELREQRATLFDIIDSSFNQMNSDGKTIKSLNNELKLSTISNGFGAYSLISIDQFLKLDVNLGIEYKHYFLNNHFYLEIGVGAKITNGYGFNALLGIGGNF